MSSAEFLAWCEANDCVRAGRSWDPCTDCDPDFCAEMRDVGKCDGEPATEAPRRPRPSDWHERQRAERRDRISKAAALWAEGLHAAAIARHMGVSRSCVTRWLVSAREGAA